MSAGARQYFRRDDPVIGVTIAYRENGEVRSFSESLGNRDYEDYLAWLAEGNTPEPWPPAES